MLVDLTPIEAERIESARILKEQFPDMPEERYWKFIMSYPQARLETGIYFSLTGNLHSYLFKETSRPDFDFNCEYWSEFDKASGVMLTNSYGVADNIEQIKEYFRKQIESTEERYFITITYIYQEGSFRWHKNGPYIGELNPQCECLDDEDFGPDFPGYVLSFHCYQLP